MADLPAKDADYVLAEAERDKGLVRQFQAYTELRAIASDLLSWWSDPAFCTPEKGADIWQRLRTHIDGEAAP
jgi:hypothetical protein